MKPSEQKELNKKSSVASGVFWSFSERICAQLVSTLVGIILARLLSPDEYGIISIVMVFIAICNVFVTRGFGTTIVQKKEVDELDYNTAFYLNMILALGLYFLLFVSAPVIERLYNINQLSNVIRVLGIRIPFAALNTIQQAYIQRNMQFKKFFIATLVGTCSSCAIGVALAYRGFGVWALVAQYLSNVIIDTVSLCFVSGWYPTRKVSLNRAKYIISFGGKLLITDLICTATDNYRNMIVGKVNGVDNLAYMEQGKKYPGLLVNNVNSSIQKVMLPAFSSNQEKIRQLKELLRLSVNVGMYVMSPILLGFIAVSHNFVEVILTEKWLPVVPFLCVFSISYLTRPFESICHQSVIALGGADRALKILMLTNTVDVVLVTAVVLFTESTLLVACTKLITTLLSVISFLIATRQMIGYCAKEQIEDILPSLILSCCMGIVVYIVGFLSVNKIMLLIMQIIVGGIIYILVSALFRFRAFLYMKSYLKKLLKTR